ncbi:Na+/H+ antiporter NhaA [Mesorhizobium sp. SB112]|uniref:Na+/H+ antiporter NhaA n=1 Tax=Mesorhizobium sp. SB112 TaxID=3151853 RepID=UPI003264E2FE
MPPNLNRGYFSSTIHRLLDNKASGTFLLLGAAMLAMIVANSPLADEYFSSLNFYLGSRSVQYWMNDALLAVFFLFIGLETKREILAGQLSTCRRLILPGAAAAGGMIIPALIYFAFNWNNPTALRGWAIPSATDVVFTLGMLSLLEPKVPKSLKIFVASLAIITELGSVIIIAVFFSAEINLHSLVAAALIIGNLLVFNRTGVLRLWPYLSLGVALWMIVLMSGIQAKLIGIVLALTIPIRLTSGTLTSPTESPLCKLKKTLDKPVAFLIIPIFGFANVGVSFTGVTPAVLIEPISLGIVAGSVIGKLLGVFGIVALLARSGWAELPVASWGQLLGVSLLCGIGFTTSLSIGSLAFEDSPTSDTVRSGIFFGSLIAGLSGYTVLRLSHRHIATFNRETKAVG